MNNFKKYLPSKKFITTILVIIILIIIIFAVKGLISLLTKDKLSENNGKVIPVTVGTIIQKDTNDNGIADWEEYIWGLDPNKDGEENKNFILSKKSTLTEDGSILISDDSKAITDNEILSRQFFATIMSLQQTDSLNDESIKSVSDAIGQKIEAVPMPDIYKNTDLITKKDSTEANATYFNAYSKLVDKYADRDIGKELVIISQGLGANDPQALYAVTTIASAYISFSGELINIPVPESLASIHLNLANNYNKTGQSIGGLTKVIADPIIAMQSIINYKKYSDDLVSGIEKLAEILQ